jgi:membrane peptidoglycan carboxypeptidase
MRGRRRRSALALALGLGLLAGLIAGGAGAGLYAVNALATGLPDVSTIPGARVPAEPIDIYDRSGLLLYEQYPGGNSFRPVALGQISHYLTRATIDVEDRTFYTNSGVDWRRIVSAATQNVMGGPSPSNWSS